MLDRYRNPANLIECSKGRIGSFDLKHEYTNEGIHKMKNSTLILLSGLMFASLVGCRTHEEQALRLELRQTIAEFDRPESCSVSLDGRYVFVSNCASGEYGPDQNFALARGRGAISKLSLAEDGSLTMQDTTFVEGITAPLGQSPLPVATDKFPRGALFVNTGFFMQTDENDEYIRDSAQLGTGVSIFDAESGERLGFIPLGIDSPVAARAGTDFLVPNGLAFDPEGNLYVGETGGENTITEPNMTSKGGVLRIDHAAIDRLAAEEDHDGVSFVELAGTNGVLFDAEQRAIMAVTCTGDSDVDGIYRIAIDSFGELAPELLIGGQNPLDAIVKLPSGRYVCSAMTGELVAADIETRTAWNLSLPNGMILHSPSDIKLHTLADGTTLLLVPEQESDGPDRWAQRLRIFEVVETIRNQ